MSQFATNSHLALAPLSLLSGLINNDNGTSLDPADFNVQNLLAAPHADPVTYPNHNTQIDLDITSDDVENNFVTLHYIRIDLAILFSACAPTFREVDVPLGVDGLPKDNVVFWAEVKRKFGVKMSDDQFTFTLKSPGVLTISAKEATNVAYIGEFDIVVGSSLASRVSVLRLAGFSAASVAETAPFVAV